MKKKILIPVEDISELLDYLEPEESVTITLTNNQYLVEAKIEIINSFVEEKLIPSL